MHRRLLQAPAWVGWRHLPPVVAVSVVLIRLVGLARPLRADEAGFLLVARAWEPGAETLYGPYFVDRPPSLVAVVAAADALAGPMTLRVVGALGCGLTVLLAARVAALVGGRAAVGWATLATGALLVTPQLNVVAVKGEVLALPLVLGAVLAALLALRASSTSLLTASLHAALAGVLGALAVGLKQNLVGGLVFAGVLLLAAPFADPSPIPADTPGGRERSTGRRLVGLLAALAAGALVPVLATVAWAVGAGVHLDTLWYTVVGFRSEASSVLTSESMDAPARRALLLLLVAVGTGLAPLLAALLLGVRRAWRAAAPVTAAALAMITVDLAGVAGGGSFWRDYLFPLVPGAVLAVALLSPRPSAVGKWARGLVLATAGSAVVSLVVWVGWNATGQQELDEVASGSALADSARPGDTLVVYGGRPDLQLETGMPSPYRFLWSLPMRTLDPDRAELRALLSGPDAPTWLVEWVPFSSWNPAVGPPLERTVEERYVEHGAVCGDGRRLFLLRGVERPAPLPDC
ncbi:hypothetical protein [Nocardioides ferulae]|uniref:hypothetical protein n=1 Tax=Nocardioides ferulae TaxID=2340821 RepID=UPI000EB47CA8|nr:hypothetical protein [Nocardioides ferulae]